VLWAICLNIICICYSCSFSEAQQAKHILHAVVAGTSSADQGALMDGDWNEGFEKTEFVV